MLLSDLNTAISVALPTCVAANSMINITKTTKQFVPAIIVVSMSLALSACAGKKKQEAQATAQTQAAQPAATQDITRPPQTIVGRKEVKQRNPDETISFDEWRKKRLEEIEAEKKP